MLDLFEELGKLVGALDRNQIDYALCGGIQLRRLCLSLGTAKIVPRPAARHVDVKKNEQQPKKETK